MNYITAREAAEKWNMSLQVVRRMCRQERVPGTYFKDGNWYIPAEADRPKRTAERISVTEKLPPLARKLTCQKKKRNYHGLYDYAVINLSYSSNRMASNRLTRGQVETIFKKGKVSVAFEPMKVSDVVEVLNHCFCVDYIIDTVMEPLTIKYIKNLHYLITFGTVDERKKRVAPGQFRTASSYRKERFAMPADSINGKLKVLLAEYESKKEVERRQILDFHVRFERIFPFDDCNGRIGRLIMFKECLSSLMTNAGVGIWKASMHGTTTGAFYPKWFWRRRHDSKRRLNCKSLETTNRISCQKALRRANYEE